MSQAGDRLQGDVSLKSNTIMLDTLVRGQGQRTWAPPQPKRPAPALPPPVSTRDPNKILSPRAEVGVIIKAKANSPGNSPEREKAVERKGQDVPDVRTPACMKAPGVPPLLVRASEQSPEKIAGRLYKLSGASSEIGVDPLVMRIVQWGYRIPFVTLPPLRHQGQETTYPGFYTRLFLVTKATGEWRPIIRYIPPQCFRALPELHY